MIFTNKQKIIHVFYNNDNDHRQNEKTKTALLFSTYQKRWNDPPNRRIVTNNKPIHNVEHHCVYRNCTTSLNNGRLLCKSSKYSFLSVCRYGKSEWLELQLKICVFWACFASNICNSVPNNFCFYYPICLMMVGQKTNSFYIIFAIEKWKLAIELFHYASERIFIE